MVKVGGFKKYLNYFRKLVFDDFCDFLSVCNKDFLEDDRSENEKKLDCFIFLKIVFWDCCFISYV